MPPTGFIRVQAVTSQAEVPVEGATVSITGTNSEGERELLSLQRTDESGLTDDVRIDTPEAENSQSPDMAKGWTDVTVTVTHPNYDGIVVRTVQVFPGVITVQEAILIPRGALPSDQGQAEVYDVPPQGL